MKCSVVGNLYSADLSWLADLILIGWLWSRDDESDQRFSVLVLIMAVKASVNVKELKYSSILHFADSLKSEYVSLSEKPWQTRWFEIIIMHQRSAGWANLQMAELIFVSMKRFLIYCFSYIHSIVVSYNTNISVSKSDQPVKWISNRSAKLDH